MSNNANKRILDHFLTGFEEATRRTEAQGRRIGAELKFPLVDAEGAAVPPAVVDALWQHLIDGGWRPDVDEGTGRVVGARKDGEQNETVASCETGYCKTEFSLAHSADLQGLSATTDALVAELTPFLEARNAKLLCYGIQPVSPPSAELLMKKMRASFWDKAFPSNNVVPAERGDDVHLFTLNACSHVHVSVSREEAVRAVDILNGFAGAQISLTANSGVAGAWTDAAFKCLNEKFWDWWEPAKPRVGVPVQPFRDLPDYVRRIAELQPVYVKRDGQPILLCRHHDSFASYFALPEAAGVTVDGREVTVVPETADIAVHNSCYWYTARISRYYTVENRVFDEQPRDALLAPAALTLGLLTAAAEAEEELSAYDWDVLRETREAACRGGLNWQVGSLSGPELAGLMLDIAERGLRRRGRGEETFLSPLRQRLARGRCPADDAAEAIGKDRAGLKSFLARVALQ